jgi:hypothetical protein
MQQQPIVFQQERLLQKRKAQSAWWRFFAYTAGFLYTSTIFMRPGWFPIYACTAIQISRVFVRKTMKAQVKRCFAAEFQRVFIGNPGKVLHSGQSHTGSLADPLV